MARSFVLVPEPMYRSLLSSHNASPLNEAQKDLSNVLSSKMDAGAKNILYNNKLYNFLKNKRELEEKPFKVEVVNKNPEITESPEILDMKTPKVESFVEKDEEENVELSPLHKLKKLVFLKRDELGVFDNHVLDDTGKTVSRSNVERILMSLLNKNQYSTPMKSIPGTKYLKERLMKCPEARNILGQKGSGILRHKRPTKRLFRPQLWTLY